MEKLSSSDVDGYSGTAVRSFTQAELARGSIDYVHSGKSKYTLKSLVFRDIKL